MKFWKLEKELDLCLWNWTEHKLYTNQLTTRELILPAAFLDLGVTLK